MTLSAMQAGIAGLVIGGSARDGDDMAWLGFPVLCVGRCIIGTTMTWQGPVPEAVRIGTTVINPDDLVIGDGVVIVPRSEIETTIVASTLREAKEADVRRRMQDGESLQDIIGFARTS